MGTKIVNGVEVSTTEDEDREADRLASEHEKVLIEREKVKYRTQRAREYPSIDDVVVALVEKYEENRPDSMSDIMTLRTAIKEKYPKPQS